MATYDDLRTYFEESRQLQQAVEAAARVPIVSGFTLDVNPIWAFLYDIEYGLISRPLDLDKRFPVPLDFLMRINAAGTYTHPFLHWMKARYQGYRRRNLYSDVPAWKRIASEFNDPLPVTMTIVHRPLRTPVKNLEDERDEQEYLLRLLDIARNSSPNIRIEERPAAQLALASGDSILAPNSGTLGGVLDEPSGNSYGVTCAHVASRGNAAYDNSRRLIGHCVAESTRVTLPAGTVCDPVQLAMPNPYPGNGPDVNMLDCALIGLKVPVVRPKIAGVAKSLTSGQDVTLTGAKTNTTPHKLGALCISYCFSRGGKDYCFRDSIELLPQPWGPVGGILGQMMTTVPVQGDSGGWVLTDDQPPVWAGLFFAVDGNRGFAIRASWVHDWAQQITGTKLSP
jgi:hypothetical protein